jgi:hypothetical protein
MTAALRPMNLGELLDRSFFLYRKHFLLFLGIIALPHMVSLAVQLIGVAILPRTPGLALLPVIWSFASLVVYLAVAATAQGATVVAVSKVHLGNAASVSEAFAAIKGRILSLSMIMIGLGLAVGVGFVFLIIPGIILGLMWSLTIPVAVVEGSGFGKSVARSTELTKGSRGKIFVVCFLFIVLIYIVYMLWEMPILIAIGMFAQRHGPQTIPLWTQVALPVGTFLTQCLVGPLMTIALSLVYYDQRVRKEAFDIQYMMSALDSTPGAAPATA